MSALLFGLLMRGYRVEDIRAALSRLDCRHVHSLPTDKYCTDCGRKL